MSLSSVAQETLESVQTFARDLESNGSSLAVTAVVLLVGISSQVGVLLRAKNTNPWLLLAVSTGSIITTLSWFAFGARLLVTQERELLVSGWTPTAVAFPEMAVRQITEHATLAGPLLAVMFVLAGVALSRVLGVAGFGVAARMSAVASGLSLSSLSVGLGRYAFLTNQIFPRGTYCGPGTRSEMLWWRNAETAEGLRTIGLAPQIRGPDRLESATVLQVLDDETRLGQESIEVQEISGGLKRMIQMFKDLRDAASDSGAFSRATFHPIVVAAPTRTGSRLAPVFRQVAIDADSVQLAFVEYWWLDRPLLGRLQAWRESAVLLELKPVENSTPLELGADEAYGTFATRAVAARQRGRIHLVLPKE